MAVMSRRRSPLRFRDLMSIERIGQVSVSPDGTEAVYVVARHDPKKNEVRQTIRVLDLATGRSRVLTPGPGNHRDPAWSSDGKRIAFVSDREKDLGAQVWVIPVGGGEARRVTKGYGGAQGPLWAPDSRRIVFARKVVVSSAYDPRRKNLGEPENEPPRAAVFGLVNEKSTARVADELLFRHWDSWRDRMRNHIFLVDADTGRMRDLTPHNLDAPPIALGSDRDYDFSPDGREIAFVMNPDGVVARSTNNCIFVQRIRGLEMDGEAECVSNSEACDCHPRYAPDGSCIYYLAMDRPGYEADKNRIKAYDRKRKSTAVSLERFDRSPHAFEADGAGGILFAAQDRGRVSLYRLDLRANRVRQLTFGTTNSLFRRIPGSNDLLVGRESTTAPLDLYRLTPDRGIAPFLGAGDAPDWIPRDAGAAARRLTRHGDVLARVRMNEAEEFWYPGAGETPIHGFLVRPPSFREGKKYPLILLLHGGPQSAFLDQFHYRWNAQLFAARGAVVAMLNPRGSTGFGQRFSDQISRDWGGRCFEDIRLGVDLILRKYRFIDGNRMAAAGASFGGFLVNWIAGRTDRFRALVSHDGIFNAETMAYTTEELWFDEYEHGPLPHTNRRAILKFSPHLHVSKFRTPTLVIHGDQDFRCPISEGIGMFTALQVMGVPSRFLHFPDEGHWVQKPANAEVWYHEVIGWLMKHIERAPAAARKQGAKRSAARKTRARGPRAKGRNQ
jgi:dipeptidyl aminopeptidase/acylaminoacyl peptidase